MAEMNLSTAELLQQMIDIKQDMRTALNNKDVYVVGGMITYPSAIDSISQGVDIGGKIKLYDYPKFGGDFKIFPDIFDTSNVTNMSSMFNGCTSMTSVPLFDTGKVTNMGSMFNGCTSLTTIPLLNTSKVTNMNSMFYSCNSLTTIPLLNTRFVEDMNSMFYNCTSLTTIPSLDTIGVMDMSFMFEGCSSLTSLPLLDLNFVDYVDWMFEGCTSLTDVGGFKDFGRQPELYVTSTWGIDSCRLLTRQSCINIFNNLHDRRNNGVDYKSSELVFHPDVMNRLTADDIAIATNKGWIVTSSW